ncbi:MAG: TetR/AcrR family transcriptional regulator [Phycisphaerae bacterium]|nr:TetR/AcrR family transcriptional regulator [Phycisphaerae bacterium]
MAGTNDSTREALLDAAKVLAQTQGYNAFSFRDLADRVGITTASIHYHFPTKAHLGRELVIRYRERLMEGCRQIDARATKPRERLERFIGVLRGAIEKGTRMCLCGMFGAEFATLPGPVRDEVRSLFEATEGWMAGVLGEGRSVGAFRFDGDPERVARQVFASLQGGMMTACAFEDEERFNAVAEGLIRTLTHKG